MTAAIGVVAVHVVLGLILLSGLAPRWSQTRDDALATFDVMPPPPPIIVVEPAPPKAKARERSREAAPPNRHAVSDPVVAPPPLVPLPSPAMAAPPLAADGAASAAGAASVTGPGTGAGGSGEGMGSGTRGAGTGGGGTRARLIRGGIAAHDYPGDARRARLGGAVTVRFTVAPDGRARNCSVTRSSGVASLDATTCRLVEKRFRYDPARDAAGRPVAEERGWRQDWWLEGR